MQVSQQLGGHRSQLGLSIELACWDIFATSADAFQALIAGDTGTFTAAISFAYFCETKASGFAEIDKLVIIFCGPSTD